MKFCLLVLSAILALSSAAVVQRDRRGGASNNYYGATAPKASYRPPAQVKYNSPNTHSSSNNDKDMKTLRNEQEIKADGSYRYAYETENGIVAEESGVGGVSAQGSSRYISPEGIEIKTTYVADETGYHAVGDHIPKIPDYILKSLEYIRTHPYKTNKDNEYGPKQVATNQYKVSNKIAPPTRKSNVSRRITPAPYRQQPAKITASGTFRGVQNKRPYNFNFQS